MCCCCSLHCCCLALHLLARSTLLICTPAHPLFNTTTSMRYLRPICSIQRVVLAVAAVSVVYLATPVSASWFRMQQVRVASSVPVSSLPSVSSPPAPGQTWSNQTAASLSQLADSDFAAISADELASIPAAACAGFQRSQLLSTGSMPNSHTTIRTHCSRSRKQIRHATHMHACHRADSQADCERARACPCVLCCVCTGAICSGFTPACFQNILTAALSGLSSSCAMYVRTHIHPRCQHRRCVSQPVSYACMHVCVLCAGL